MLFGISTALSGVKNAVSTIVKDGLKLFYNFKNYVPDSLLDGATSFDGTNDYIKLANNGTTNFANQSFTISAWIKPSANADNPIFSYDFTSHTNPYYAMHFRTMTSGRLTLGFNNGVNNIGVTSANDIYTVGVWQHVCATFTSGTQKVYHNGSVVASGTNAVTITFYDQEVWIGKANFSGGFNGSMANVGIWDRALSSSEIESIMWRGSHSELEDTELTNLVSWYDLKSTTQGEKFTIASAVSDPNGNETDSLGNFEAVSSPSLFEVSGTGKSDTTNNVGNYAIKTTGGGDGKGLRDLTLVDGGLTIGASYTLSFDYKMASGIVQFILQKGTSAGGIANTYNSLNSTSWASYSTTFTATEDDVRFYLYQYGSTSATWYFDNLSLKEVQTPDSVGTNNGAIVGATTLTDSYSANSIFKPRIQDYAKPKTAQQLSDGSTYFDGSDDYIDIGNSSDWNFGSSNFAISCWVKVANLNQGDAFLIAKDLFDERSFYLVYDEGNNNTNKLTIRYYTNDSTSVNLNSSSAITDTKWHHFFAQKNGNSFDIYIDGSLDASGTTSGSHGSVQTTTSKLFIGAREYSGANRDPFNGSIANVGIWTRALTQNQIQEVMFSEGYAGLKSDLGSELVTNGSWGNNGNTNGWSTNGQISIVNDVGVGGTGDGALKVTTTGLHNWGYQEVTVEVGKTYRFSVYQKNGNTNSQVLVGTSSGGGQYIGVARDNANWGEIKGDFIATGTSVIINLRSMGDSNSSYSYFDNCTIKEIKDEDCLLDLVSWYDLGTAPVLGSELITNGNFDGNASTWILDNGWTYNDNNVQYDDVSNVAPLRKVLVLTEGVKYRLEFTVGGNTLFLYPSSNTGAQLFGIGGSNYNVGTHIVESVATHTTTEFRLYAYTDSAGVGTIDNISLKPYTTAPDSAGSNDGTIVGATTNTGYTSAPHGVTDPLNYGTIHSGTALDFDGTNDYITLDGLKFDGNQASLGFWVNFDTIEANAFLIDFNPNRFIIGLNNTDGQLGLYDGASWKSFGSLTAGVWNHIVVVLNNTTAIAYVNGVQLGSNLTITAINVASATDCVIGANFPPNDSYVDAKISSVKVFDSVLTQAQVRELYLSPEKTLPTGVSSSALKLDMPMQEGSGTVVHDGSPVIIDITTNGDFSADSVGATSITGWSLNDCTAEIIADGYSGNGVKITRTNGSYQGIYQDVSGVVSGNQYKVTVYARLDEVYTGSEGMQPTFRIYTTTPTHSNPTTSGSGLPMDASWKQYTHSFTAQGTTARIELQRVESDPGSIWIDSVAIEQLGVGQNHGTISGATWVYGNSDGYQNALVRSNKPMIFDGSNDTVTATSLLGDNDLKVTPLTISCWAKISQAGSNGNIIGIRPSSNSSKGIQIWADGSHKFAYAFVNTAGGVDSRLAFDKVISDDKWHHIVFTSNGNGTYLGYVDGVNIASTVSTGASHSFNTTGNTLAISSVDTYGFDGLINEVAIWDEVLTANEISAIYNNGLPINLTANSGNYTSSDSLQGYWRNNGVTTWTDLTPLGVYGNELITNGTFEINTTGWTSQNATLTIESGGYQGGNYLKVLQPYGSSARASASFTTVVGVTYNLSFYNKQAPGNTAWWTVATSQFGADISGENQITETADWSQTSYNFTATTTTTYITLNSGSVGGSYAVFDNVSVKRYRGGNHGTVSGSPASVLIPESNLTDTYISGSTYVDRDSQGFFLNDTSKVENGIKLNGNEYINVGTSEAFPFTANENKPFTIDAWVNVEDLSNANGIIGKSAECFFIRLLSNGRVEVYIKGSGGGYIKQEPSNVVTAGWHHLTVTYDGSGNANNIKIYWDSSEQTNSAGSSGTFGSLASTSNTLHIGNINGSSNFIGELDDVKIYHRVLSSNEITKNYKRGLGKHS